MVKRGGGRRGERGRGGGRVVLKGISLLWSLSLKIRSLLQPRKENEKNGAGGALPPSPFTPSEGGLLKLALLKTVYRESLGKKMSASESTLSPLDKVTTTHAQTHTHRRTRTQKIAAIIGNEKHTTQGCFEITSEPFWRCRVFGF